MIYEILSEFKETFWIILLLLTITIISQQEICGQKKSLIFFKYLENNFVLYLSYKSMKGLDEKTRYKVGDNPQLDRKFALYKKVNLFTGEAYHDALSQEEAKVLIKLWGKAR